MNHRRFISIVLVVFVIIVLGAVGYFVLTRQFGIPLKSSLEPTEPGHGWSPFSSLSLSSPSGALAIRVSETNGDLWVSRKGGAELLIDTAVVRVPVFSPDETLLAYFQITSFGDYRLVVASVPSGTERRTIAEGSSIDPPVAFSPSGQRVAFVNSTPDGVPGIYIADLSKQPSQITQATNRGIDRKDMKNGIPAFKPVPTTNLAFTDDGLTWVVNGKEYSSPVPTVMFRSDTTNWKTYRDEKFGFEVKYPNDYVAREDFPCGRSPCPYFTVSIVLKKYALSASDTPGLTIYSVPTLSGVERGVFGRVFQKDDRPTVTSFDDTGHQIEYLDALDIYFQENGQTVRAKCEIYNDPIEATINACNQIISTFTFMK